MKNEVTIPVVILKTRSGYNAFSPLVDGCAVTDKTIDRTLERMRQALEFHLEGERLVKQTTSIKARKALKQSFEEYGTDAVYAALKIAA